MSLSSFVLCAVKRSLPSIHSLSMLDLQDVLGSWLFVNVSCTPSCVHHQLSMSKNLLGVYDFILGAASNSSVSWGSICEKRSTFYFSLVKK